MIIQHAPRAKKEREITKRFHNESHAFCIDQRSHQKEKNKLRLRVSLEEGEKKKKMKREAKKGGKKKLEMEREERESGPTYANNESSASTSFEYLKNIYIFAFKNETI